MRLNLSNNSHQQHLLGNQSLLSQSLSDLRSHDPLRSSPMILNNAETQQRNNLFKSSTPVRKRSTAECNFNNNCDEDLLEETNFIEARDLNDPNNAVERLSRIASPDSMATMTPTSSQVSFLFIIMHFFPYIKISVMVPNILISTCRIVKIMRENFLLCILHSKLHC